MNLFMMEILCTEHYCRSSECCGINHCQQNGDALLNYLLTPWCRVLLEKLTGLQLVKKFSAFLGTRMFITALTSVRHLSLSWASPIQSIYPHPTTCRSILILSNHLRLGLPSGSFPPVSPPRPYTPPSPRTYAPHAQPILSIQYRVKIDTAFHCTTHNVELKQT